MPLYVSERFFRAVTLFSSLIFKDLSSRNFLKRKANFGLEAVFPFPVYFFNSSCG
jgi:hypothetical protein